MDFLHPKLALRLAALLFAAAGSLTPLGAATLTVTNTNNASDGSLRQAIIDANGTISDDVIVFNIPGPGVHTIVLAWALPAIIHRVTIDGYAQPGSSANTNPTSQGLNIGLKIEIDGTGAGSPPA